MPDNAAVSFFLLRERKCIAAALPISLISENGYLSTAETRNDITSAGLLAPTSRQFRAEFTGLSALRIALQRTNRMQCKWPPQQRVQL